MTDDELLPSVVVEPPGAGSPRVSLGGGRWAPRDFHATYHDPASPFDAVHVWIIVTGDGVALPIQVAMTRRRFFPDMNAGGFVELHTPASTDWATVRNDDLRVPLLSIVTTALAKVTEYGDVAAPGTPSHPGQRFTLARFVAPDGYLRDLVEPLARPTRRTPTKFTPQLRQAIADVLDEAERVGTPKRRAVIERFGPMHENTAKNWIKKAEPYRRRGAPRSKKTGRSDS